MIFFISIILLEFSYNKGGAALQCLVFWRSLLWEWKAGRKMSLMKLHDGGQGHNNRPHHQCEVCKTLGPVGELCRTPLCHCLCSLDPWYCWSAVPFRHWNMVFSTGNIGRIQGIVGFSDSSKCMYWFHLLIKWMYYLICALVQFIPPREKQNYWRPLIILFHSHVQMNKPLLHLCYLFTISIHKIITLASY